MIATLWSGLGDIRDSPTAMVSFLNQSERQYTEYTEECWFGKTAAYRQRESHRLSMFDVGFSMKLIIWFVFNFPAVKRDSSDCAVVKETIFNTHVRYTWSYVPAYHRYDATWYQYRLVQWHCSTHRHTGMPCASCISPIWHPIMIAVHSLTKRASPTV